MPTFAFPHTPPGLTTRLRGERNAPLPDTPKGKSRASVVRLTPAYYPRTAARLVSCYALFE